MRMLFFLKVQSLAADKNLSELELANQYLDLRVQVYRNIVQKDPTQKVFPTVWAKRVETCRTFLQQ